MSFYINEPSTAPELIWTAVIVNQFVFRALALEDPSELSPDLRHDSQEQFIGRDDVLRKELQHGGHVIARQYRKCERRPDTGQLRALRSWKVAILRYIGNPRGSRARQHASRQPGSWLKIRGLSGGKERSHMFRIATVPDARRA